MLRRPLLAACFLFALVWPCLAAKPTTKLVPVNVARGKAATADGFQDDPRNPNRALDGDRETRYSPPNGKPGHWWQVDLGAPVDLTGGRIVWESDQRKYQYTVEGSADGKNWRMLSDQTGRGPKEQVHDLKFTAPGIRYVKISVTALNDGSWGSFWEVELYSSEMVTVTIDPKEALAPQAVAGEGLLKDVKAPPGFEVSLFAAPPDVSYPTCLTVSPEGVLFVGMDLNGSLGRAKDRGKIVRCIDTNGDGRADKFNDFCKVESPRGLVWDRDTLWVLHPPMLSVFRDTNGDGTSDSEEVLLKGLGGGIEHPRGADHTTNGIQMGIDGWIYIAAGDFGFPNAETKDGKKLRFLGGGLARIRPDGTELEIVSHGQRNIYDVAIDPQLNLFTRDNTNDGGGWDVRLSHVVPTGHYGYPMLFKNSPSEIIQPLADYGGGSPCGSLFVHEPTLPAEFGNTLYTVEWGRGGVFRHPLAPSGATFKAEQTPFLTLSRPTDMEVDGQGRLYVSSWHGGGFNFSNPNVGFVIRVQAQERPAAAFPALEKASDAELLTHLASASHVLRFHAQREVLRRGEKPELAIGLEKLAETNKDLGVRVAAIFTLKQLLGAKSHPALVRLCQQEAVREFALKALADRTTQLEGVPLEPFTSAVKDANPRVRLQAALGLGRLGRVAAATQLMPLSVDMDPVVAHVAVKSLIAMGAGEAALKALATGSSEVLPGAARVAAGLHDPAMVAGLIELAEKTTDASRKNATLAALCRLYQREHDWNGTDWWGTRPDTTGPYFKPVTWGESEKILAALQTSLASADADTTKWLLGELSRNRVRIQGASAKAVKLARAKAEYQATAVEQLVGETELDADAAALLEQVALNSTSDAKVRLQALQTLAAAKSAVALPALVRVLGELRGQKDLPKPLLQVWEEFVRDARRATAVNEFAKLAGDALASRRELAYAVLAQVAASDKPVKPEQRAAAEKALAEAWKTPAASVSLLRAIGHVRAGTYALVVSQYAKDANPEVKAAAAYAVKELGLDETSHASGPAIATLPYEKVLDEVQKTPGDVKLGKRLFERTGCIACHTTAAGETPKGPFLGGIADRYKRAELAESVLRPSAKIAQGFQTQYFVTADGLTLEGFVSREGGDDIELRNQLGVAKVIPKSEIEQRGVREVSIMPQGLADKLSVGELAAILAYMESLKAK